MTGSDVQLLGAAAIRELAGRLGVAPTKQWGQNFVVDANTVRRIVRAGDVGPQDVVVEVGPGLGSLTLALLGQGRKTLRAALKGWAGSADAAEAALVEAGIDPRTRGEQLDVEQFAALAAARTRVTA